MDGTYFVIRDVERFAQERVNLQFRHSNWASFLLQLHLHGFRKVHDETLDCHAFKHPDFQRDDPSRMSRIQKQKSAVKEGAVRSSTISAEALEEMQMELTALRNQIETMCDAVREMTEKIREIEQARKST